MLNFLAIALCVFVVEKECDFIKTVWRTTTSKLSKVCFLFAWFVPELADSVSDAVYFGTIENRKSLVTVPIAVFYTMVVFLFTG